MLSRLLIALGLLISISATALGGFPGSGKPYVPSTPPPAIVVTSLGDCQIAYVSTVSQSPSENVPSGSLITVWVNAYNGSNAAGQSVSDTESNTYYGPVSTGTKAFGYSNFYYAYDSKALTTSDTITFSDSDAGVDYAEECISYATGVLASSSPLDGAVTNTASGSGTPYTITSGAPSEAGELFLAYFNALDFPTTQSPGWSDYNQVPAIGYLVNAGSSAQTYAPTGASFAWGAGIIAFKPQ